MQNEEGAETTKLGESSSFLEISTFPVPPLYQWQVSDREEKKN